MFRLKIKENKTINEIKATKELVYSPEFFKKYKKPGYYIRFTNEIGTSGQIMLTPNYSSYKWKHTPIGIYGYPLDNEEVIDMLMGQRLTFQNLDLAIIYYVDPAITEDLKDLAKNHPNFIDKLKEKFGEEKVLEAVKAAYEKDKSLDSNIFSGTGYYIADGLNFSGVKYSSDLSKIYWYILRFLATSAQQTALLHSLNIKAVKDDRSIIDTGASGKRSAAPVQGLVLSSTYIKNYEVFTNPSRTIQRKSRLLAPEKAVQINKNKLKEHYQQFMKVNKNISSKLSSLKIESELRDTKNGIQLSFTTPMNHLEVFKKHFPNYDIKKFSKYDFIIAIISAVNLTKGSFVRDQQQIEFETKQSAELADSPEAQDRYIFEISLENEKEVIPYSSSAKLYNQIYKRLNEKVFSKPVYEKELVTQIKYILKSK